MFGLGPLEIGVIVVIVVALFGPTLIRRLVRSGGETVKELRKVRAELKEEPHA